MTSSPPPKLPERVRRTLRERSLLAPGDGVVVAVSGGPDSLALLLVLAELAAEWSLRLVVGHLDHGMRPGAGAEDAAFVAETAAGLGLSCVVGHADVPGLARARRLSIEAAGREARYAFLAEVASHEECQRIATGHTADDRVETVLLNLARGTGIDGLAGFPASRPLWGSEGRRQKAEGRRQETEDPSIAASASLLPSAFCLLPSDPDASVTVVRPLVDCWRREVLEYCAALGLSPRRDVTNDAPGPLRNRIRRELLPWMEQELSSEIRPRLLHLATLAEEEGQLLRELSRELVARATRTRDPSHCCLDAALLAAAPPALARRALREAVRDLRGDLQALDRETFATLLQLARGERRTAITLPGARVVASREADALILRVVTPPIERAVSAEEHTLTVPGTLHLREPACRIQALSIDRPRTLGPPSTHEAFLDIDSLALPLVVRHPRPGDRMAPLGMRGHRKLHDILIDRKIPRPERAHMLLVSDQNQIVWLVGCCISEAAKVTPETTRVLRLTIRSTEGPAEATRAPGMV